MLLPSAPRLRIRSWAHSSNILVSAPARRCITLIPAYNGDPAPGGSNGDGENHRKSSKGENFSKPSRRKGREAHLRSPYDTPLRDGNRDRLIGLLTERAAKTLMVYLMETNVMLHNWLVNFYKENAIPKIGPWDEVSGEAFLRKLLAMPVSSAKVELGRDALFDNSAECGVDPRSMAQRIMDIRTQLATEFVQDLMGVKEENIELLRETLASSLMGGLAVHPTVPYPAPAEDNTTNASGNGNGKGSGGTATKARPLSAGRKPYDPGEGRRKRPIYKAPSTDSSVLRNWRLEALYSSSSDDDSHPIEDVPHLPTPTSFAPGSGSTEPPKLPPKFQAPPNEPPYKAYMDAAAAADPSLFSSTSSGSSLDSASDDEGKKGPGENLGAAAAAGAAALGNGDGVTPSATPPAPADNSSGGDSNSGAVRFNIAAAEAAFSAPAATPAATPETQPASPLTPPADAGTKSAAPAPEVSAPPEAAGAILQPSEVSLPEPASHVTAPAPTASTEASTPPAPTSDAPTAPAPSSATAPTVSNDAPPSHAAATDVPVSSAAAAVPSAPAKRGPPTEKQLAMMHPEIAEMMRNNTGDWQDLYPEIAAVLEQQEAAVQHQPSETTKPDTDAPPPPSPDTPQPKA